MKKIFLRTGELSIVFLLIGFIIFVSSQNTISSTPFKQVAKAVASECNLKKLEKGTKLDVKRKLSFDAGEMKGCVYYSSNSVMDVRELLILSSENKEALNTAYEKISAYISEKAELFEGYAPKESELISSHLLVKKRGFLLFYIGEETEKVLSAFSKSL